MPPAPSHSADEAARSAARWTEGWARPADESALLALFARAFGHEMPAAQWRWKYAGLDPIGSLVRHEGQAVAFYGGMPRRTMLFGAPVKAVQIGDVMVDPAERGVLTRRGPFFLAAKAYAERMVGPGRAYALAFGFPSERHTRLGEHLGLYARVDEVLEASWPALPDRRSIFRSVRPLARAQLGVVDLLWEKMAAAMNGVAIGVRDAAHVQHRFLEHPAIAYLCLLARQRLSGAPVGVLVLRDHGPSGVELMDVVAAPQSLARLVEVARRVAGRLGRERVFAWVTPSAADSLAASRPALVPAGVPIPTIVWSASPDLDRLRGRWWLTGGDADFR